MGITAIANGTFAGMVHLFQLDLSSNSISSIRKDDFKDLTSLKVLSLASNALSTLGSGTFEGLSQLWKLDLSRNSLRELRAEGPFRGMPELRTLVMTGQRPYPGAGNYGPTTMHIGNGTFSGSLAKLALLDMSGECCYSSSSSSAASVIERGAFDGLTGLQSLRLNSISLDDAGMAAGLFEHCRGLKQVELRYNGLTAITDETFAGLSSSLESLTLHGNRIRHVLGERLLGLSGFGVWS